MLQVAREEEGGGEKEKKKGGKNDCRKASKEETERQKRERERERENRDIGRSSDINHFSLSFSSCSFSHLLSFFILSGILGTCRRS